MNTFSDKAFVIAFNISILDTKRNWNEKNFVKSYINFQWILLLDLRFVGRVPYWRIDWDKNSKDLNWLLNIIKVFIGPFYTLLDAMISS